MYFSFLGERKVPKESPLKESTQVLSLRILSPVLRALFAKGQKGPMRCHFTDRRKSATSAERRARGFSPFAGTIRRNSLFLLRVSGIIRADGAPPFVRAIWYPRSSAQSDSFAPLWAKGSRAQVVGSVREAPGGLPCVALFWYFSLDRERKVHISISPTNCNFKFQDLQKVFSFPLVRSRNIW